MILAAIGKMSGVCTLRNGTRSEAFEELPESLVQILKQAVIALANELIQSKTVESGTFGVNDPLTISHLTELERSLRNGGTPVVQFSVPPDAVEKITKLASTDPANPEEMKSAALSYHAQTGKPTPWCISSAFFGTWNFAKRAQFLRKVSPPQPWLHHAGCTTIFRTRFVRLTLLPPIRQPISIAGELCPKNQNYLPRSCASLRHDRAIPHHTVRSREGSQIRRHPHRSRRS